MREPIVVAVGGAFMGQSAAQRAYEHLTTIASPDIPVHEKCIALPDFGLNNSAEITYGAVHERVGRLAVNYPERPIVAIGHSRGGLVALQLGVRVPNVKQVVTLAAPLGGVRWQQPGMPLGYAMPYLHPSSAAIKRLRTEVAHELPPDVRVTAIAVADDEIVPLGSQLDVAVPEAALPPHYVVASKSLGEVAIAVNPHEFAGQGTTKLLYPLPVEYTNHYTAPRIPSVARLVGLAAREAAELAA